MLVPSVDLLEILHRAQMGIWTELPADESVALVAKLPQSIIKKIYRGIDSKLITSVIEVEQFRILYLGFCIYDEIENPLVVIQPVATQKAQTEFQAMVRYSPISLHFFDELCHPILSARCEFDSVMATEVFRNIQDMYPHALSIHSSDIEHDLEFARAVEKGIDVFQTDLDSIKEGVSSVSIPKTNHVIPLSLALYDPPRGYSINAMGNSVEFTIDQADEGGVFEELSHHTLNDLYRGQTFLRPSVNESRRDRELADLLALDFEDNTICLIQAKAVASLILRMDQSSRRRSASTEKQVERALKQLIGAIRHIRAGDHIFDCNGTTILVPSPDTSLIHAIVLVSELYPFADWKKIGTNIARISENDKYRALFHVLDLQELQQLVASSRSPKVFHNYLLLRWFMVKTKGTAYVRGRSKRPYDNEYDLS